MNPCDDCPIDDKIYECCGRFPETGESAKLKIADGRVVDACPYLLADGRCAIYARRPLFCQMHFCYSYQSGSSQGAGYPALKDQWGEWGKNGE